MSTTVNVAGSPVSIFSGDTIVISDKEAGTSTAQFTVWDSTGTGTFTQQQTVTITDSVRGLQFSGYVDSAQPNLLNPGPAKKWIIICKDKTWLPSKRQVIQPDFAGTLAGDVVTDLHAKYLAAEGITANYALDHDTNTATFGLGTLVNTSAATGNLTLSPSGTTFTKTETSTADFGTGTLSNVIGSNNTLRLTSASVMKFVGTASANVSVNPFVYVTISNTGLTLNSGDYLIYDLFISSTSPQSMCGIDLIFTDGSNLRSSVMGDLNGLDAQCATDLSLYAKDQWYHRVIPLTNVNTDLSGHTIAQVNVGFEGDTGGTYTAYIRNVTIQSSSFTVRQTYFNGSLSVNRIVALQAYFGVKLSVVTGYADTGVRVSPAYSISSVGIVRNSLVSWSSPTYAQVTSNTYAPPVLIELSYDGGATWQVCTNFQPIPNMLPGMNTSGRTVTFRQTLSLAGPSPELSPMLNDCTVSIAPSYAMAKSDAFDTDANSTDFGTGTRTNVTYTTGIGEQISGAYRNWDDTTYSGQTVFSPAMFNPNASINNGQRQLRSGYSGGSSWLNERLDFAGQWADFVLEVDIMVGDLATAVYPGILFRTAGWQSTNDATYAYNMQFEPTRITWRKGSNTSSGGGADTVLATSATYTLTANTFYHMKIVASGTSVKCYLNDTLYINATDGTYTGAGYVGLRLFNGVVPRNSAIFDNFGIMSSAFSGNRQHSSLSLNALGSVEDSVIQWNATTPGNTSLLIESSINGGGSWQTCTNNAEIPQLTPGVSTSGVSLLIRETLTTQNANSTPQLTGITAVVVGNYNATGTRVSPALAIGSVGRVGSSSITWSANTPTGTTLVVEESLIGATGAWTGATNGGVIPTITSQPVSVSDGFSVSTAGNYTSTNYGGVNATWAFDTANSRLTGLNGTNGLYVWNQVSAKDVQIDANLNQAANAGVIWRYTDVNNFYFAIISDASSGTNPNTIKVYKRAASVTSGVLATGSITFTRGTYHTLRIAMTTTSITAYFDGVSVASVVDAGLAGPGSLGFLQSSTTQTNWYSIRGQQFGDDVTGKSVWTRCTLTSTDPTLTPAVTDLVTSVRGQQLMSGGIIGVQNYQYTSSVMAALSDVTKKCPGYTVGVTDTGVLTFQSHTATPADWPLASTNSSLINGLQIGDIQWSTPPTLVKHSPLYRNRSIIVGGMDITALIPDSRRGDGFTQSWRLAYPVASRPTITLNGQPANVGVRGVDTGMDFYYLVGDPAISQDAALTPLDDNSTVLIAYYGQIQVVKQADNVAQQTIVAALEGGTSGIVEVVTKVDGLSAAAAQALATADCAQWSILSTNWTFTTLRPGLKAGQLLQCFVSQFAELRDVLALITQVDQRIMQGSSDSTNLVFFDVTVTTGANVGSWTQLYL